jgi:hypothetical protein
MGQSEEGKKWVPFPKICQFPQTQKKRHVKKPLLCNMISHDLLDDYRNAILAPLIEWIKDVGSWKVSAYSGVSKRRINTIVKYPQYRKNLDFNEFCLLFTAYQKHGFVNKSQNYYGQHLHKARRFRLGSSKKSGDSSVSS